MIPSPSPSLKIQISGGNVCLRCKGKTLLGVVNKLLKTKILLTSPSNVCLITSCKLPRQQFEFSLKVKVMGSIQAISINLFYLKKNKSTIFKLWVFCWYSPLKKFLNLFCLSCNLVLLPCLCRLHYLYTKLHEYS